MHSILNERDRAEIHQRLQSLSSSSARRWGSMDVLAMLQHLCLSTRMALGDLPVPSANKRAFQMFPIKHLILYVLPFPKGAPTAPELKPFVVESFEGERAALLDLLDRMAGGVPESGTPDHPLFGPLTWHEWGVATYKHTNHHLKQFGA